MQRDLARRIEASLSQNRLSGTALNAGAKRRSLFHRLLYPRKCERLTAPLEARRILKRLEFHYTPKHGSWLNMAEIEFSVAGRECLDRRIPSAEVLEREIAAYEQQRNRTKATINWRFTNQDARTKLDRLYPSIEH